MKTSYEYCHSETVFYTRVINNLKLRLNQHKENITSGNKSFASKYKAEFLLYYKKFTWIQEAISREKR